MGTDFEIMQSIDEAIKSIWENRISSDYNDNWIRKNAAWAKGKVTELNASLNWGNGEPQFYVVEH